MQEQEVFKIEKIIIQPKRIRGWGNIVSPTTTADYIYPNSQATANNEEVNGAEMQVFSMLALEGSYFTVTKPNYVEFGNSFNIQAVLKYHATDSLITSSPVQCIINGETVQTSNTDGQGLVSFSIQPTDAGVYLIELKYKGTSYVGGCYWKGKVTVGSEVQLDLEVTKEITQKDASDLLLGKLSCKTSENESIPIIGQLVSIYEEYYPKLVLKAPKILQLGDESSLSAKIIDEEDGSIVAQSGTWINFYKLFDGIAYELLNDEIISWTTMANRCTNGLYEGHGSYLNPGWSNEGLWKLEFTYKYVNTKYVGLMPICSAEIKPYTDGKNGYYAISSWEGSFPPTGLGFTEWISQPSEFTNPPQDDWNDVVITKLSSTRLKIVLNGEYTWIGDFPNLANLTELHIGIRDNPASRNTGGYVVYKDVYVTYLNGG